MTTQTPGGRDPLQQMIIDELKALRAEQATGFNAIRAEFNARLDRLVTTEAFAAEQRRVDQRFAEMGQDIVDERLAREKADDREATRRSQFIEKYELERADTAKWQRDSRSKWILAIVGLVASPIVVAVVQYVLGGAR
ncbi:hypothetical protein MHY85_05080 [Cellulomonas sp. ACRRI]|uniref:hypothetical protein n=1 Tax=Cellulomonas sp. ACRRI TaxID=2918188 RepID=UPI001EF26329|nr:hypothetical protein [Cellulomonas sp. ACRRI]MCG7285348.1 hypothetical protein [Cellulomonas sp. ACRRI]